MHRVCVSTPTPTSRRHHPAGLTLVEVLLVLALLVLLASMTWPALQQPMANQRLRKAADKVRIAWVRARVDAMSDGQTHLFRFVAGGSSYQIEVRPSPQSVAETQDLATETDADQLDLATVTDCREYSLPEGIVFVEGEAVADTRSAMYQETFAEAPAAEGEWSEPMLFHPDGTTSDATLVLANQHNRQIKLKLRGLTGVVRVGDTYVGED